MSTNRNKELEHAYTLMEVREYIADDGAYSFLLDLKDLYPEAYSRVLEAATTLSRTDKQRLPALLSKPVGENVGNP